MWTPDDFPGADNVPWQLLIRARFAHEIDAIIASLVVNQLGARLGRAQATRLVEAAVVKRGKDTATAEQKVAVISQLADWDGEICPPNWPFRWPPKKRGFEELSDPITVIGLARAQELVGLASPQLKQQFGDALGGVAVRG
jgi:hypothetical protein